MRIAIVGLGYVGIQLAVALGRKHQVVGLDLDEQKVTDYQANYDATGEVSEAQLRAATHLEFTTQPSDLKGCDIFIIAVPTPVDPEKNPDFGPLVSASRTVGSAMAAGATVVYESTVYPGATEEVCVPELEQNSGLTWKKDFSVGYSPERINPGDPEHTLATITKVVSADNDETLDLLADLYGEVVTAGIHRAPSIRVAEAAKVIENTQRDLNIALMNELALILDRMNIRTSDVLEAAGTKWNFLRFHPGLVGGHCLGVDPYYLTAKAKALGYHPEVILAGRRINDAMGRLVAGRFIKLLIQTGRTVRDARVAIFGVCYKPDVGDARNSRVPDIVQELRQYGIEPLVVDHLADSTWIRDEYGIELTPLDSVANLDGLILAVPHASFLDGNGDALVAKIEENGVLVDVIGSLSRKALRDDLKVWSL